MNELAGQPERPFRCRARVKRDLRALAWLLVAYILSAYLVAPAWWRRHELRIPLQFLPKVTRTAEGIPGDPINIALVGTQADVVMALLAAGWYPADPTTIRTSIRIARNVLAGRSYPSAPVSNLYLNGRRQDLAFEQPAGKSPRRRHHVRFWRSEEVESTGRPIWMGAATFDVAVGLSHRTGEITHHIGPDLDTERDKLFEDLAAADRFARIYQVSGIGPTREGRNGGGDRYYTDGQIKVGILTATATKSTP